MLETLHVSLYESHLSLHPIRVTASWEDLVEIFSDHREADCEADPSSDLACPGKSCDEKKGAAWSPCSYKPEEVCVKDPRSGGTRLDANVSQLSALVLDLDHLSDEVLLDALTRLEPYERIVHTTHNTRPGDACLRVVLRLSRTVAAADWPRFHAAAVAALGIPADPTCKNLSRIYFLPSHPRGGMFDTQFSEGKCLDVDAILAVAPPHTTSPKAATALPRIETPIVPAAPVAPESVDLGRLVGSLKRLRNSYEAKGEDDKADLVRRIVEGEALAETGGRDHTVNRAASILAVRFSSQTPVEAALEVLRPSLAAMPTEPEGLDYWLDEARDCYERAMNRRVEEDRRRDEVNARLREGLRSLVPPSKRPAEQRAAETPDADPDDEPESHPDEWMESLIFRPVKKADDEPQLVSCEYNAGLLLTNLPEWKGCIRWNELTKDIEVTGSPLPPTDRHVSVLPRACADYLHRFYGIQVGEHQLKSTLLLVARRNPFDPIREYLDKLKWDGIPRLKTLLVDYCNAKTVNVDGEDISHHVEEAGRKWMIAAAVRVLSPGEQVDSVLVLEGKQGSGKSRFFRTLAGRYAATSQLHLASKDAMLISARSWIVELAELDSVRKSEREATNAALTVQTDIMRPPYGAAPEEFPRRCVFAGTTEDDDWLSSAKGIRRWWPVSVGVVDLKRLRQDRDQLWAEATVIAKAALAEKQALGEVETPQLRWWFTQEEEKKAQSIAAERVATTVAKEAILSWWYSLAPNNRPPHLTTQIVLEEALKAAIDKPARSLEMEISTVLRDDLGCVKTRKCVGGARMYVYVPSEIARTSPRIAPARPVNPAVQSVRDLATRAEA